MMKRLLKGAAVLTVLAALIMTSSCKQAVTASEKKNTIAPAETISLTIEGDNGITVKTATLTVDKGSSWKNIKAGAKAAVIVKEDYELTGWKFGGAGGTVINDKQAFKSDSIVFAVSKKRGIPAADEITITLTGDERVRASSFTLPKGTAWKEARGRAEAAFTLKAEWQGGDYGAYCWERTDKPGTVLADDYKLKENEKIYVRTNYIKFKIEDTQLTGYTGEKPRGRITIPADVKTIGSNAFAKCFELERVYLESGVQTIGIGAFAGCVRFTGVLTIPDSVRSIGRLAFTGCAELTGVHLGVGVETISEGVFAGCTKLTGLTVADGNSTYCSENNVIYTTDKQTLVCGAGGLTGTLTIPNSVQTISSYAFYGCTSLTKAVFTAPTGWAVYDDSEYTKKSRDISVADAETAAEYLCKHTNNGGYANKWWKKN